MEKVKCKSCEYCACHGRMQYQRGWLGRKIYYCENPKTKELPTKAFGNKALCFIGFGKHRVDDSPLELKTAPRWCPINNEKK